MVKERKRDRQTDCQNRHKGGGAENEREIEIERGGGDRLTWTDILSDKRNRERER